MTTSPSATAAQEWKNHWTLPVAAALGYTTSVIHIYGISPYVVPIAEDFEWTRSQVTGGLTLATAFQALIAIPVGLAVDRYGPRPLGVIGVLLLCGALALLGTATGGTANWYMLWAVIAVAAMPVQATVWTSAVATRFHASRGLAFAITLCGASVATALFPVLGAWLIGKVGWQNALAWQGGIWSVIAFPMVFLFFRSARDKSATPGEPVMVAPVLTGKSLAESFRSTIYLRLLLACLLFTVTIIALVVHFVSILTDGGTDPIKAGAIAALVGLASIAGRLGTGLLIDRFQASKVGAIVFLLPVLACLSLLWGGGDALMQSLAAIFIGLTLGAEVDVVAYLTTRHFGLKHFGALYGGMLAALSLGTAIGPLAAAQVFDRTDSYDAFLWMTCGLMVIASLCLLSLPKPAPEG